MIGTFKCIYETPCGWCTKWDKKCNQKCEIEKKYTIDKSTISEHTLETIKKLEIILNRGFFMSDYIVDILGDIAEEDETFDNEKDEIFE